MRVALVAPVRPRCGIADYTRALLPWLRGHTRVELIPSDDGTGRVDYRALGERVNAADVGHVQYEHGFFLQDDDPAGNFDAFHPGVAVLVTVEWDHPDVFADLDAVLAAFEDWIRAAAEARPSAEPPLLVANVGDPGVARLVERLRGCYGQGG